jgi:type IV secretory pathway protease TraF
VASSEKGIANGQASIGKCSREADSTGRDLPRHMLADYTLKEPELLLMSDVSTTSFDGRYFRWGR